MSLRPIRQVQETNIDFITPWTQEKGGCLTLAVASGITFVQYAFDPNGAVPLGIQLNDIEYLNLSREIDRRYAYNTDLPCGIAGIATQGDFETDWIYLIGSVFPGDNAYVGPSGTFTNSSSFGSQKVGKFLSALKPKSHVVTMRGLGFSRQLVDPITKAIIYENNPADRILVVTPGFIKIRINKSTIIHENL